MNLSQTRQNLTKFDYTKLIQATLNQTKLKQTEHHHTNLSEIQESQNCFFFVCLFHPTQIWTYKSAHGLTNQTKLKSIFIDMIWLKVLRNSCTVRYLFLSMRPTCQFIMELGKVRHRHQINTNQRYPKTTPPSPSDCCCFFDTLHLAVICVSWSVPAESPQRNLLSSA